MQSYLFQPIQRMAGCLTCRLGDSSHSVAICRYLEFSKRLRKLTKHQAEDGSWSRLHQSLLLNAACCVAACRCEDACCLLFAACCLLFRLKCCGFSTRSDSDKFAQSDQALTDGSQACDVQASSQCMLCCLTTFLVQISKHRAVTSLIKRLNLNSRECEDCGKETKMSKALRKKLQQVSLPPSC